MENQMAKPIPVPAVDVESGFLREISMWSVIGNNTSVNKLRVLLNSYHNDQSEGKQPNISPIVFHGNKHSGRTVMAHAVANSMASSYLYTEDAMTMGMGGAEITAFLNQGDQFSSYLILNAEYLIPHTKYILYSAIRYKKVVSYDMWDQKNRKEEPFHKLVMFSTSNIEKVAPEIVKKSVDCSMQGCSNEEILQVLKQRTSYLNWQLESDEVLNYIVRVCNGSVSLAIQILKWSYRVARSGGKYVLESKHLNRALHFMQQAKR